MKEEMPMPTDRPQSLMLIAHKNRKHFLDPCANLTPINKNIWVFNILYSLYILFTNLINRIISKTVYYNNCKKIHQNSINAPDLLPQSKVRLHKRTSRPYWVEKESNEDEDREG